MVHWVHNLFVHRSVLCNWFAPGCVWCTKSSLIST